MGIESPSTRYHVIVPHIDGQSALVLATDDGHSLPGWVSAEQALWEDARPICYQMKALFGMPVAMLRGCLLDWSDARRDSYYLVENLDPKWRPPAGGRWIGRSDLDRLRWCDERDRGVLAGYFAEQPAPRRVGWYRPGWFCLASEWIRASLESAGIEAVGEIEQLRSWERSSVMRFETRSGYVYFKAAAPQWGHEPALTCYLGHRFPGLMPDVINVDPALGMMLVGEFQGAPLPEISDLDLWKQAYASLGRVQRELIGSTGTLRDLGVPLRDPTLIFQDLPLTLRDRRRMRAGMDRGLSEKEIDVLLAAEERLAEACRRLATGPIALSLDHGDFWPGNIFAAPDRITLFDWSDATITHPFFSLVMAAEEISEALPDQRGAAERVIDVYLAEWTDYAPMDELRSIFADAMLVAPIHLAIMYRTTYLPAMEFPDELDRMTPHFLRWLVGAVSKT